MSAEVKADAINDLSNDTVTEEIDDSLTGSLEPGISSQIAADLLHQRDLEENFQKWDKSTQEKILDEVNEVC